MLFFIITLQILVTIATYYILFSQKTERKLLAIKFKRLRKQNHELRKQCRKLKIQAEWPAYFSITLSKIQEEEIQVLKNKLIEQEKKHLEFKENKWIVLR